MNSLMGTTLSKFGSISLQSLFKHGHTSSKVPLHSSLLGSSFLTLCTNGLVVTNLSGSKPILGQRPKSLHKPGHSGEFAQYDCRTNGVHNNPGNAVQVL